MFYIEKKDDKISLSNGVVSWWLYDNDVAIFSHIMSFSERNACLQLMVQTGNTGNVFILSYFSGKQFRV